MKTNINYLLAVIFMMMFSNVCRAQLSDWQNYNSKRVVSALAMDGTTLYVGTNGGGLIVYDTQIGERVCYDRTHGLADNRIVGVECLGGQVWIGGNNTGLSIFDGKTFTNAEFPLPHYACFEEDKNTGKVYVGGLINIYVVKGGRYYTLTPDQSAITAPYPTYNALKFDAEGRLWFAGFSFGYILPDETAQLIDCGVDVNDMVLDKDGNKWLATKYGLKKYDNKEFTTYNSSNSTLPNNMVLCLDNNDKGNLWLGTYGMIVKFDGKEFHPYTLPAEYGDETVTSILCDGDNVWMGTTSHGLLLFKDGEFTQIPLEDVPFYHGYMYGSSAADDKGNVYFAAMESLIHYDEADNWEFPYVRSDEDIFQPINGICFDHDGNTWFATNNSDTVLVKILGSDTLAYTTQDTPLKRESVKHITFDGNNHLWAGTTKGLYKFDGRQWTEYSTATTAMQKNSVSGMAIDGRNRVWFGVQGVGLYCLDGGQLTEYTPKNSSLPFNYVSSIAVDSKGRIWMNNLEFEYIPIEGMEYGGGLVCLDGQTWRIYDRTNSPIGGNTVLDIAIDKNDALWLAVTNVGLVRFDGTADWYTYSIYNSGLSNPWIKQIQIDTKRDRIWTSHDNGGGISSARMNIYTPGGTGLPSVPSSSTIGNSHAFDLMGRPATHLRKGEVYIINGKKVRQ